MAYSTCNPIELFPTRSHKITKVYKSGNKGGFHHENEVTIPIDNTAYARTVRAHEAAHSLYTKRRILANNAIGQGVEDARIHTLLKTQGSSQRDELCTALTDLRGAARKIRNGEEINRALAVIISLRTGAILAKSASTDGEKMHDALCGTIGPKFKSAVSEALKELRENDDWAKAETIITRAVKAASKPEPPKPEPKSEMPSPSMPATKQEDSAPVPPAPKLPEDEKPEEKPEPEDDGDSDAEDSGDTEDSDSEDDGDSDAEDSGDTEDSDSEDDGDGKGSDWEDESLDDEPMPELDLDKVGSSFDQTKMTDAKKVKRVVYEQPTLESLAKDAITAETVELLSPEMLKEVEDADMPKLNIWPIFKSDPIRAKVGSDDRHSIAGQRIDSKKLSMIVTPSEHKIFLKKQRHSGGTIVIDASGSMQITLTQLESILLEAPVATIAFYNAYSDSMSSGNLWIFAYRGKRAKTLEGNGLPKIVCVHNKRYARNNDGTIKYNPDRTIKWEEYMVDNVEEDSSVPKSQRFGYGNVVDFQVCQWLLAQPKPRYFVTDKEFIGSSVTSNKAALELTKNAEAIQALKVIWSDEHKKTNNAEYTFELLRKELVTRNGR